MLFCSSTFISPLQTLTQDSLLDPVPSPTPPHPVIWFPTSPITVPTKSLDQVRQLARERNNSSCSSTSIGNNKPSAVSVYNALRHCPLFKYALCSQRPILWTASMWFCFDIIFKYWVKHCMLINVTFRSFTYLISLLNHTISYFCIFHTNIYLSINRCNINFIAIYAFHDAIFFPLQVLSIYELK